MPVTSSVVDRVATISFGGTKGNSLPGALLRELASTVEETGARDDVRVLVIRSEGEGPFCAGASFDELKAIADERSGKEFFLGFARVILAMTRCAKPVVARVQGRTAGGGGGRRRGRRRLCDRRPERGHPAERAGGWYRTLRRRSRDRAQNWSRRLR